MVPGLRFRGLAQDLTAVVNGPFLVAHLEIGQGLALLHGDDDLIGQLPLHGDLLDIGELGKDPAGGRDAVKEEQVVALFDDDGLDDLLVGVMLVSLHLNVGHAEENAHHKDDGHNDHQKGQQRADAGLSAPGRLPVFAVLAGGRLVHM